MLCYVHRSEECLACDIVLDAKTLCLFLEDAEAPESVLNIIMYIYIYNIYIYIYGCFTSMMVTHS